MARWRARLLVLGLGLAPFLLLEIGLRIGGYGEADRFGNFAEGARIFRTQNGQVRRDRILGTCFRTRPFLARKTPGAKRVFVVGDSVTLGFTYHSKTRQRTVPILLPEPYPRQLEAMLARKYPGQAFEVLNCGGVTHASFRLLGVVREVLEFSPDLVVVMTGTSEFLEARTYKDWDRLRALRGWRTLTLARDLLRLAKSGDSKKVESDGSSRSREIPVTCDDELRGRHEAEQQLAHSEHNLRAMASACREAGVPMIVCTVPADLRHPPRYRGNQPSDPDEAVFMGDGRHNRDRFERLVPTLAGDEEGRFTSAVSEVVRLRKGGDPAAALEVVRTAREALASDPRIAVLYYCEGRVLDDLGRFAEAKGAYEKARDLDLLPTRATGGLNRAVRELASEEAGVFLADVVVAFDAAVPDGIPDSRLFYDNCHPRPRGHSIMARLLCDLIVERRLLR